MVAFVDEKEVKTPKSVTMRGVHLLDLAEVSTAHLKLQVAAPCIIPEGYEEKGEDVSVLEQVARDLLSNSEKVTTVCGEELRAWFVELEALEAMIGDRDMTQVLSLRERRPAGKLEQADLLVMGEKVGSVLFQTEPWPMVANVSWDPGKEEVAAFVLDVGCYIPPVVVSELPGGKGQIIQLPSGVVSALQNALYLLLSQQSHA